MLYWIEGVLSNLEEDRFSFFHAGGAESLFIACKLCLWPAYCPPSLPATL